MIKLEEIPAYKISSDLSDYVWNIVIKWEYFQRKTVGCQFTEAIDSIPANIAEGYGRYHKKDKIKFYYNARASVFESSFWSKKSHLRKLINEGEFTHIIEDLRKLPKEINTLIKTTNYNLKL